MKLGCMGSNTTYANVNLVLEFFYQNWFSGISKHRYKTMLCTGTKFQGENTYFFRSFKVLIVSSDLFLKINRHRFTFLHNYFLQERTLLKGNNFEK